MNLANENIMDYYDPDDCDPRRDFLWYTRDGKIIKIADMTDQHLYNAYKFTRNEFLGYEILLRLFKKTLEDAK